MTYSELFIGKYQEYGVFVSPADEQYTYTCRMSLLRDKTDPQLAANGPTIVTKMRLVAVTLLDALAPSPTQDGTGQDRSAYLLGKSTGPLYEVSKGIELIIDFLQIMSSIEDQFITPT